jgi:uncharacterized protein (UPF0332 family)
VPNSRRKELSDYRVRRAGESIVASDTLLEDGLYLDSINRSYYAIFHSIRAVLALEGVDFKRHSSVISHFNKEYVHGGKFDAEIAKYIADAFKIRNDSDYDDFYVASRNEAEEQLAHAKAIAEATKKFIDDATANDTGIDATEIILSDNE